MNTQQLTLDELLSGIVRRELENTLRDLKLLSPGASAKRDARDEPEFWTLAEASFQTGWSKGTLSGLIKAGKLKRYGGPGRLLRVRRTEVLRLMEEDGRAQRGAEISPDLRAARILGR